MQRKPKILKLGTIIEQTVGCEPLEPARIPRILVEIDRQLGQPPVGTQPEPIILDTEEMNWYDWLISAVATHIQQRTPYYGCSLEGNAVLWHPTALHTVWAGYAHVTNHTTGFNDGRGLPGYSDVSCAASMQTPTTQQAGSVGA
jgi:hypothetical protein